MTTWECKNCGKGHSCLMVSQDDCVPVHCPMLDAGNDLIKDMCWAKKEAKDE